MTDDEINEIPPEKVLDRESILRAKLKEALQDRDEARKVARMAYIRLGLKFMGDAIKRWEEEQKEEVK